MSDARVEVDFDTARTRGTPNPRSESGGRCLDQPIGGRSGGGSLERSNIAMSEFGSSFEELQNVVVLTVRDSSRADIVAWQLQWCASGVHECSPHPLS